MDPLTAFGVASNIAQFLSFVVKLCALIKECSTIEGCPKRVSDLSQQLQLRLQVVGNLSNPGRPLLNNEKAALLLCAQKAEDLRSYLEKFQVTPIDRDRLGINKHLTSQFLDGRLLDLRRVCTAFKFKINLEKIQRMNDALDDMISLIQLQSHSRVEQTSLRVEKKQDQILVELGQMKCSPKMVYGCQANFSKPTLQPVFMVAASRNNSFVGREEILKELSSRLASNGITQSVSEAALYGLGGVGKSQVALEYVYQIKQSSSGMSFFWVHAASVSRFEQDYKSIAKCLRLPGLDDTGGDILQLVYEWLEDECTGSWLMIIDNADGNELFETTSSGKTCREYIPRRNPRGTIIYTSRNRHVCNQLVDEPIHIPQMTLTEARLLLGDRLTKTCTESELQHLLEELDFLPLAIRCASRYMTATRKSISDYLTQYRESRESKIKLLTHQFSDTNRRERGLESVAAAWMLSFNHIKEECPRACDILCLMSFFDRQGIPKSLVSQDNENCVEFDCAIIVLENYSLITMDEIKEVYTIHRLVQVVTNAWIVSEDENGERKWALRALKTMLKKFPNCNFFNNWPLCALYVPHVVSVLDQSVISTPFSMTSNTDYMLTKAHLLRDFAYYLDQQGRFNEAVSKGEESLQIYCDISLGNCTEALLVKATIAASLTKLNKNFNRVEILLREALEGLETLLGPSHKNTVQVVVDLAYALIKSGVTNTEAETLAWRAVTQHEIEFGRSHRKTVDSLTIVALAQTSQGRLDEAEKIHREVLDLQKLDGGENHTGIPVTARHLARLLARKGKYLESERLARQGCEVSKAILGCEHQQTAHNLGTLGESLYNLGHLEESEKAYREALPIAERHLGAQHPTTFDIMRGLGCVLRDRYQLAQAEKMFRQALENNLSSMGERDERIMVTHSLLAEVIGMQGRLSEAKGMYSNLLEQMEEALGPKHQSTMRVRNALDGLANRQAWEEATPVLKCAIEVAPAC